MDKVCLPDKECEELKTIMKYNFDIVFQKLNTILNRLDRDKDRIIFKKKEPYPKDKIPTYVTPEGKIETISKKLWYKLQG